MWIFLGFYISSVIINVLRESKKKEERKAVVLGFRCGDISPV